MSALTLEVALDGSKPYTSIQSAINASNNGDSILVYPGTYQENIDYNSKNISIASLYQSTHQSHYIDQTIIDGRNLASCVKIIGNESNVSLSGFTLVNGKGSIVYNKELGGGILITENCTLNLSDCIIKNCFASEGAGINLFMNVVINMKNTKIFDNNSSAMGGGIHMYYASINFNQTERNSIYKNYGLGADIVIMNCDQQGDVFLDKGSVVMTDPDQYFIIQGNDLGLPVPDISVNIQQAYLQTVNHDLFVAPDGSDQNSGLSPAQPLRSIAFATHLIESDSLNPKTIYLASGTYYRDNEYQKFPLALKSHTALIGSTTGNSILDNVGYSKFLTIHKQQNIRVENVTFQNCESLQYNATFQVLGSKNISLKNLKYYNINLRGISCMVMINSENITLEDIIARNCQAFYSVTAGIACYDTKNLLINNVLLDSLSSLDDEGGGIACMNISSTNTIINNLIMSNTASHEYGVFQFQNDSILEGDMPLTMTNSLIINNDCNQGYMFGAVMNISNSRPIPHRLTNVTIANNHLTWWALSTGGKIELNNCILYNPELDKEVIIHDPVNSGSPFRIDYSLLRGGSDLIQFLNEDSSVLNWGDHNIDRDPLFVGGDPSLPSYYRLSANSPCINSGTPDTLGYHLPPTDLAGNPRMYGNRIDMGCYEYNANAGDEEIHTALKKVILRNYPNPIYTGAGSRGSNPYTIFEFYTPEKVRESAEINIYNIKGQKVRSLRTSQNIADIAKSAGLSAKDTAQYNSNAYSIIWNAQDEHFKPLPTGVYLYQLSIDGRKQAVNKLMILK